MADGYDRFDNEGGGGGSFVMGLLTGTVLGAGLGMLFAPKSGSELRNQVAEQAGSLANTASEGYRRASEAAGGWAEKGREAYDKARDAVNRGADEAQRYVKEATGGTNSGTGSTGSTSAGAPGATGYGSDPLRGGTGPMGSQPGTPGGSRRS
jgi:gas vesicle protein